MTLTGSSLEDILNWKQTKDKFKWDRWTCGQTAELDNWTKNSARTKKRGYIDGIGDDRNRGQKQNKYIHVVLYLHEYVNNQIHVNIHKHM